MAPSTYYENINRHKQEPKAEEEHYNNAEQPPIDGKDIHHGRPITGYSLCYGGRKISDEQIKEYLSELICSDGFPYGYRKLTMSLKEKDECYSRYEFKSFMEAYVIVTNYMRYYNERRRHGSIKYMAPNKFYEAFMNNTMKIDEFSA